MDIHVRTLRDKQEYSDINGVAEKLGISSANWSLFGVIWDSGKVLAHKMYEYNTNGLKILEVGCGIGLASLVLNHQMMDITATDYHPEVDNFLKKNTELNNDREIPFICTNWADDTNKLGKFDLIIGSDVLYERNHVLILANFIQNHSNEACKVILVDPGRGHHAKFSKEMINLGFSHKQEKTKIASYLPENYHGQILYYSKI